MANKSYYKTLKEHVLVESTVIPPFTILSEDIPKDAITDMLARGLVKKVVAAEAKVLKKQTAKKAETTEQAKKSKLKTDKERLPKLQKVGRWNIDPVTLVGKTKEQLDIMVAERDSRIPIFDTIEEVAAHLTKDFRRK